MTQQLDAAITQSPEARVQAWLADFESALAARDIERVVAKFVPDSIWRDLVTFTWNIKTVEGREPIAAMLRGRLADTDPLGFRTRETPTDDGGGVASAFIEFETAVGRGVGHLRLKGDLGWTLLAALDELKGHEEPMGSRRVLGAVHGPDPAADHGRRSVRNRRRRWGIRSSPTS
jgi:putative flavoprotein involved in K+ transport